MTRRLIGGAPLTQRRGAAYLYIRVLTCRYDHYARAVKSVRSGMHPVRPSLAPADRRARALSGVQQPVLGQASHKAPRGHLGAIPC
jgi:hypothetical protein